MAQKIQLDLLLNTGGASQTLGQLRENIKSANQELDKLPKYTQEYYTLRAAIATANTELAGQEKLIKGLTSEEIAGAYARIGGGISSSFTAASSALRIFGVENEAVLEAAAKAQDLLTFAISTRQIQEGLLSAKMLSGVVADKARLAVSKAQTIQTNLETASEVGNTIAVESNTAAETKNTAAKGANIVATEGETVATAANTTAKGILGTVIAGVTSAYRALYAVIAQNPFTAIILLIGLLVTAVIALKNSLTDAEKEQQKFNDALAKSKSELVSAETQIQGLVSIIKDETLQQKFRLAAYKELQKTLPALKNLTLEQAQATGLLTRAVEANIAVLRAKAAFDVAAKAAGEAQYNLTLKQYNLQNGIKDQLGTEEQLRQKNNAAFQVLFQLTDEYNVALLRENILIEENTKDKKANASATQEQINANSKLQNVLDGLLSELKDEIRLYKELGKVIEVEDRIPDIVERANKAYKERIGLVGDTTNKFVTGLSKIGILPIGIDDEAYNELIQRFKVIERSVEAFIGSGIKLKDEYTKITDSLQKVTDFFAIGVEKTFSDYVSKIGVSTTQFAEETQKINEYFTEAFAQGEITAQSLKSINALTTNLSNLNKLVNVGKTSLNEYFSPEEINEYLKVNNQVLAVAGKINYEYDQESKTVKQIVIDRKNYSQNVKKAAEFEDTIREVTATKLKRIFEIEKEGFEERVKASLTAGDITQKQYEALIATLDAGTKKEEQFSKVIAEIANQRVESIKNQVDGVTFELDRIRKYNFEFETARREAAKITAKSITSLIEQESEDFIKLNDLKIRGVLRGVITQNDKIKEAERILQTARLDFVTFTEEEKLRIYEATYNTQEETNEKSRKSITKSIEEFIQIAQQAFNAYQEYIQRAEELATQRIIAEEKDKLRQLDDAYQQGLVLEKTYQEKRTELTEEYAAQRAAIEKKYRIRQLQLDRVQAIANVALGVTRAIGEGGLAGLITGAIVSAAGIAEISIITEQLNDAQALKKGGWIRAQGGLMVNGPSHEYGGVKFQNGGYELEGGEAVINRVSARNYQGLLSQINQSGGGRPLVSSFDDSRIVDAIAKQRMEPIRAYVIEQDITRKQAINKKLDQLSRF